MISKIIFILYLFNGTVVLAEILKFPLENLIVTRHRRQSEFTCTLPPHPENGKWAVLKGEFQPGGTINVNTVLKYECNVGYKLTGPSPYVVCDVNWEFSMLPTCEVLCPPIHSTSIISLKCVDQKGNEISCHEATEGTYLSYTCADFYETPFGYKKTLTCINGIWSNPSPVCQPVCGRKVNDDSIPLIYGGNVTAVIEYPWVTAVYHKQNGEYENVCGGSIISQRVVLTAAHCVTNDFGDVLPEENYLVGAGKIYNKYNDTRDRKSAQYLKVYRIVVHPSYKGDNRRYLADIAVLVIVRSLILNKWVQPVCINDVNSINLHAGNIGVVSGWGVKEDGVPSDELRTLEIPYKYETTCAQELPLDWANKYNSIDKICAGFVNRSISICKGDSGSGLFFKNPDDNRYYVHGVVSLGVSHRGECDIQQNSLYTKVAFHYHFVDRELTKYTIKECILPQYPANGKWIIENEDKIPGDTIPSNTILNITCDSGYHVSSGSSAIKCALAFNMPKCVVKCNTLDVPSSAIFNCKTKDGEEIDCNKATDLTTLTYTCSDGFMIPPDAKNSTQCVDGLWTWPVPRCVRMTTPTKAVTRKAKPPMKIVCIYDSWRHAKDVKPSDFNASLCTHVMYDIGLSPDGDLRIRKDAQAANVNKSLYEKVADVKNDNKDLKVILSVEGDGDTEFRIVAADSSKRMKFINNSINFLQTYNYDGLDINWHYPSPSEDRGNFELLIQLLNEKFKQRGWLLTVTVYIAPTYLGYPYEMNRYVDWINVQTYDMYSSSDKWAGQYSPLFASSTEDLWQSEHLNIAESGKNWLSSVKKNKIIVTIAFLGRYFTLADPEENDVHSPVIPGESKVVTYSEICQKYYNWTRVWDDEQKNPYKLSENKWLGYDDEESVKLKAAYIKKERYIGVSVWPVDGDDVLGKCGTRQILLKHVHAGLDNSVNLK